MEEGKLTEVFGDELQGRGDDGSVEGGEGKGREQAEEEFETVFAATFLFGDLFRRLFFGLCVLFVVVRWRWGQRWVGVGNEDPLSVSRSRGRSVVGISDILSVWSCVRCLLLLLGCFLLLMSFVLLSRGLVCKIHRGLPDSKLSLALDVFIYNFIRRAKRAKQPRHLDYILEEQQSPPHVSPNRLLKMPCP